MRRLLILALLLATPSWAVPARAQGFFSKRVRPNPIQRVPELIVTIKSDPDERKRTQAAEELHNFDARTYAEIVPVLVDVAQSDQKAAVRQEALNSLARLRPISQPAGQALERAAAHDESWRIRFQAKSALVKYHLAGYSSSSKGDPAAPVRNVTTAEPPLADPPGTTAEPPLLPRAAPAPRTPPITSAPVVGQAPAPITIEVEGPSLAAPR
jgi:hypothetical protein